MTGDRPLTTGTDTEVLLRSFAATGADCLESLRGMFVFAAFDPRTGSLLLARDRLGQKPLFLRREPGRLLFASESKALLQVDGAPREIDPAAVDEFLAYQYVPDPRCILKGYEKLPPGHLADWNDGRVEVRRYWDAASLGAAQGADAPRSPGEWVGELKTTLTEAVRLRLRSDVPLGAFLSGGVDSTVICAVAQDLLKEQGAGPLKTFSIGFAEKRYDETEHARLAATTLGTEHREFRVAPDALATLPRLVWHYDEPFGDSSAIPTLALSEHTRRHVTVALSGDGGDELFSGYERYRAVRLAAAIDRLGPVKSLLAAQFWQRLPASVEQKSFRRRAKRFLAELGKPPHERYLRWVGIFDRETRGALYTPEFAARLAGHDAADVMHRAFARCGGGDPVGAAACADLLTYLPNDILTKVDPRQHGGRVGGPEPVARSPRRGTRRPDAAVGEGAGAVGEVGR